MNIRGQSGHRVGLPYFLNRPFWCWVALALLAGGVFSDSQAAGSDREFRAVWVVRHTLTSQEKILEVVKTAREAKFNALLVQVRGRGDAYYRSSIIPRGEDLPEEAFDPLELVIRQARQVGIEVHAWINIFLAWYPTNRMPTSYRHILHQHPEWFMTSADGIQMGRADLGGVDLVSRGVEGRYLSPGVPEVHEHLLKMIEEIVRRYEIDGIHLDYIRYPNFLYDFNTVSRSEFEKRYGFDAPDVLASDENQEGGDQRRKLWDRWRTDQVSLLVEEIHRLLLRLNPSIKLSAAVKPDLLRAYHEHGQDWIRWINTQTIDFVVPMFYSGSTESIIGQISEARKYVKKGHLYAGIGDWNQPPEETVAQIEQARRLGIKGVVLFSYDSLSKRPGGLKLLQDGPFLRPSRTPLMQWKEMRHGAETEAR